MQPILRKFLPEGANLVQSPTQSRSLMIMKHNYSPQSTTEKTKDSVYLCGEKMHNFIPRKVLILQVHKWNSK